MDTNIRPGRVPVILATLSLAAAVTACGNSRTPGAEARAASQKVWRAEPAMISNVGVYRRNEFVYQDFIHDDHGANTDGLDRFDAPLGTAGPDPTNPTNVRQSPAPLINYAGDFMYAAPDGTHMATVADLVEFRVAADARFIHHRVLLADMAAPDGTVLGVCVDEDLRNDTGLSVWPHAAGVTSRLGCEHFFTVYGTGATVSDAAGGLTDLSARGGAVSANVDAATLEFSIPRGLADPGAGRWRYTIAAGIWDAAAGQWSAPLPVPQAKGAPVATGGRAGAPAVWDLLSNNREPNATWNEEKQANDLMAQNLVDHYLEVDFARLAENRDDPDPQLTGVVHRIYRSQHPTTPPRGRDIDGANFVYLGEWQPYAAVIPSNYYAEPGRAWPFDLCMHPLGTNHNVEIFYAEAFDRPDYNPLVTGVTPSSGYLGFGQVTSLIDRLQAVYACVLGRGEGVGYTGGDGLVDALEVQADMMRRYQVDTSKHFAHGVSLGAIGTWYMARLYPDRFAAAMPYIFSSNITGGIQADPLLLNLYNLPVFYSIGTLDQFGQGTQGDPEADQMEAFGNEYVYLHYLGRQHEGRIEQDFLPFVEALGYTRTLVENPARVRYRFAPASFSAKMPGDGSAYWVSGMRLRDENAAAAEIDVTSLARAGELPRHQVVFDGLYANAARAYTARIRGLLRLTADEFAALWRPELWETGWQALSLDVTPSELPGVDAANGFALKATNLARVQLDPQRMGLASGAVSFSIETDGPLEVRLGSRSRHFAAGMHSGAF